MNVIHHLVISLDSSGKWDKQKNIISCITDHVLLLLLCDWWKMREALDP